MNDGSAIVAGEALCCVVCLRLHASRSHTCEQHQVVLLMCGGHNISLYFGMLKLMCTSCFVAAPACYFERQNRFGGECVWSSVLACAAFVLASEHTAADRRDR
jgi:hypothetical protein